MPSSDLSPAALACASRKPQTCACWPQRWKRQRICETTMQEGGRIENQYEGGCEIVNHAQRPRIDKARRLCLLNF